MTIPRLRSNRFLGESLRHSRMPFSLCVIVVVGGGTIGGGGCTSCGLRFEGVVVVVDVTTAAVVIFDATTSRHKGFEGILQVVNITATVAAVIIPARGSTCDKMLVNSI